MKVTKEINKENVKFIEANASASTIVKCRYNKGITLISLIITIIVMLILVTTTISMVINGGLFEKAGQAVGETRNAIYIEQQLANGRIQLDGVWYNSIDEYITEKRNSVPNIPTVNLNGYEADTWTNQDIKITLTSSNLGNGKYQYCNDGTNWVDCGDTININTDQNNTYQFRSISENGTTKGATSNYSIKRDTVGPTFTLNVNNSLSTLTCNISNLTDEGSGVEEKPIYTISHKYITDGDDKYIVDYTGTESSYQINNLQMNSSYLIKVTVEDKAGNIGTVTKTAGTSCFVAGTKVLTEEGFKNIEDIKIGDKVYAINIDNNQRELKTVINLFRGYSDEIYEITIGKEIVYVTPKHQFYVVDKGWIRAYELKKGDCLVAKDNQNLVIQEIVHKIDRDNPVLVYNMTIEGYHNYLVTEYEILVHNAGSPS